MKEKYTKDKNYDADSVNNESLYECYYCAKFTPTTDEIEYQKHVLNIHSQKKTIPFSIWTGRIENKTKGKKMGNISKERWKEKLRLKYKSLVTKENIESILTKIEDEQTKINLINLLSKIDIRISTEPIIVGNEFYYNLLILKKGTKNKAHIKDYYSFTVF